MAKDVIYLKDFPPFVRFELEEHFQRKIFSEFVKRVSEAEVDVYPEKFWRSTEEEFEKSRYELIFGTVRGRILKTLEKGPLKAQKVLERNPDISPYSIWEVVSKSLRPRTSGKRMEKGRYQYPAMGTDSDSRSC